MTIRFSAITTIRGADKDKVAQAADKKRAQVASLPHAEAFKTVIPRTGEALVIFLTDEDAVAFQAVRSNHLPFKDRLVSNMAGRNNHNFESAESGLEQMVNEAALAQFLQQYPERDVSGVPHERIDCNRYWLQPGTWLGQLADTVCSVFASGPSYVRRGEFDFWRDLKNPIRPFVIAQDD